MFNITEIKKDLMKSKNMANFSHYCYGNLYYNIVVMEELYQFPIATIESANDGNLNIQLSSDLGTTNFNAEIKGSELARWIAKAVDKNQFIKVG